MKKRLPPKWTGPLVGKMHQNGITFTELAADLGVKKNYIGMVLNGEREPKSGVCTKDNVKEAVDRLIAKRKEAGA